MGTYAPAPLIDEALAERIRRDVFERTVRAMAEEGMPYRGVLFAGLMVTEEREPYLLEFNVRFGDPETQVLMSILDGDLATALDSAARGRLDETALTVSNRHALCVVMAAGGYPGTPRKGDVITGLQEAAKLPDVRVLHAGTAVDGSRILTAGGRVLGVTGRGATLREAHDSAYCAVERIAFTGMQYRRDIGARAL
jgi:phosphoribosylamine--glycine ligase